MFNPPEDEKFEFMAHSLVKGGYSNDYEYVFNNYTEIHFWRYVCLENLQAAKENYLRNKK